MNPTAVPGKPTIQTQVVKHRFTSDELAELNIRFGTAYDAVASAQAEFDALKAVHKAKITEAETRMVTLRATINAGFEYREKPCIVIFDVPNKTKRFYVDMKPGQLYPTEQDKPVLVQRMTEEDLQMELATVNDATAPQEEKL